MTTASDPILIFEPNHSTCLQNNDLPSLTNGIASSFGIMQLCLKLSQVNKIEAPKIVRAMPPSDLKVPISLPFVPKFFILQVFLEYENDNSLGRTPDTPLPKSASTW